MNKLIHTYFLIFFVALSTGSAAQTPEPYAELLTDSISVCSEGTTFTVNLRIKFYGDSPFGPVIETPNSTYTLNEKDYIGQEDMENNVWEAEYAISNFGVTEGDENRVGEISIISVEDGTGKTTTITDQTIPLVNWGIPDISAGADIDSCGLSAILDASPSPLSDNYYWENPSPGSISDTSNPNVIFEAPEIGEYALAFTQVNGACIVSDTVDVNLIGSPSATISTTSEVCGSGTQEATIDLSFEGDGPWEYFITDGNNTTINSTSEEGTKTDTTDVNGETTFTYAWVKDDNNCYARPADMADEAKVIDLLPETNAGNDTVACGMEFQLQAVPDESATGVWNARTVEDIDFNEPSNAGTIVTAPGEGTYTLTWTETNKECENSDSVDIQFVTFPSLDFQTTKDTICEGSESVFAFDVTGNHGPWTLSYEAGGTVDTFAFDNASSTLQLIPSTSTDYNINSVTDKYGCSTELTEQLQVQVDLMPDPFAGNDTEVCDNIITLDATISEIADSGKWETDPSNFPDDNIYNPKARYEATDWGEQTLTWTEFSGLCTASDNVTIRFDEQPAADAGEDLTLYNQDNTTLIAENTDLSNNNDEWIGEWKLISGTGNISDPGSMDALISGLDHGQTTLEWSVINGVCPEATDTVVITVKNLTYYTGISPDAQTNKYFKIKGAHTIPSNELMVFDQSGQLVYREPNLEEGNQWDATGLDGKPLESGIYYFIFKGEGIEPVKDYLVIKRR